MSMMMAIALNLLDLTVAGISFIIGLGFFAFVASILCAAAFYNNAKDVS